MKLLLFPVFILITFYLNAQQKDNAVRGCVITDFSNEMLSNDSYNSFTALPAIRKPIKKKQNGVFPKLYSGYLIPFRNDSVFPSNPMWGLGAYFERYDNWYIELAFKGTVIPNKNPVKFYAYDSVYMVNMNSPGWAGLFFGYTFTDNDNINFSLKPGLGFALSGTDLEKRKDQTVKDIVEEDEVSNFTVGTFYFSLASECEIPVFKYSYLSIGCTYHIIPYNWEPKLISRLNTHFFSLDISYRFRLIPF